MEQLISLVKKIPSFQNTPDNMIIAMAVFLALIGLGIIFSIIMFITNYYTSEPKKEEKVPPTHKVIMDLKEALVEEMKGTSRQNSIMIWLTLVFIAVTLIGMAISIMGGQNFTQFIQKAAANVSKPQSVTTPAATVRSPDKVKTVIPEKTMTPTKKSRR